MKLYIASNFSSRHRLRPIKFNLKKIGFEVLSEWIDNNPMDNILDRGSDSIGNHLEATQQIAARDIREVTACDIFIIDTQTPGRNGGRECELGMALMAPTQRIFRVGPIRNVFHAHKAIKVYKSWEELLPVLEDLL